MLFRALLIVALCAVPLSWANAEPFGDTGYYNLHKEKFISESEAINAAYQKMGITQGRIESVSFYHEFKQDYWQVCVNFGLYINHLTKEHEEDIRCVKVEAKKVVK